MSSALVKNASTVGLPKVRDCDGKGIFTHIETAKIMGYEPCTVTYKGQSFVGTKVYTTISTNFKVLTLPADFNAARRHSELTGEDTLSAFLPEIAHKVPMLAIPSKTSAVTVKVLGKGK